MSFQLKITYDAERKEVLISGNREGMKYLSDICARVIGKTTPAGHYHLSPQMGNVDDDSVSTVITYQEDPSEQ
jgi:hypothetical protein